MRISDWSSDVCSSDLRQTIRLPVLTSSWQTVPLRYVAGADAKDATFEVTGTGSGRFRVGVASLMPADNIHGWRADTVARSEEHTSELQSLMRISYAVFCLKQKNTNNQATYKNTNVG